MRAISALSIINNDFYCHIERIMRFYGSQPYCSLPQFRREVLSGSDKFLPYALERKCVTTDIVSSGVVGLATSEMTGLVDPLVWEVR
jgi:hypothetical protein